MKGLYPASKLQAENCLSGDVGLVQVSRDDTPQQLKQVLCHYITLTRPADYSTAAYDAFAKKLIKALLVRLSVLPNTDKKSWRVFVSDLTDTGDIVVKVQGIAVETPKTRPEATRQAFLLDVHNVYRNLLAKESASARDRA